MDTKTYSTRLSEKDHDEAVKIFNNLGLDWSTGIRIYLKSVIKNKGIPFTLSEEENLDSKIKKSIANSIAEYENGEYKTVHSTNELFNELDN